VRNRFQEHFVVLTADGAGNLLRKRTVFVGTVDRSLVHPREVLARAIADHAASVFLVHNHPSGKQNPSDDDVAVTRRMVEAGRIVGIEVKDHVIVTARGYFIFQEEGLM
jgi:DNA repair protein RadC